MKKASHLPLVICTVLIVLHAGAVMAEMVSVQNDSVNMRSGPSLNAKVLWRLGQGFPLKVLQQRSGSWLKVRDFEGAGGWVRRSVVGKSRHMIVKANKQSRVNVRSCPRTDCKVVAHAQYGVVFDTLAQQKDWIKVRHDGLVGWVHSRLLWGF